MFDTARLILLPLDAHELYLWGHDISSLEKEHNITYMAEPIEGRFLSIIDGQQKAVENDPENYLWLGFWLIVRKDDRVVVGSADFKNIPGDSGEVEIGYGLGKAFEGHGYMTETVMEMCRWALSQKGVTRVTAETYADNGASQRVLERCGFHKTRENGSLWWAVERV